ncbi:MAG: SPOR domain-containing protein [Holosporales bacterium]|jgi:hypothetical protein|nr:SPOR domain-containing protein [Holosporales bacterium]
MAVIVPDDGYEPAYNALLKGKRSGFFLLCGIASVGALALFLIWVLFFDKSTPSDAIPLISAPQTPAKVYPQDADQHDPLEEASVYNHISSTAPSEDGKKEVKPLPPPEEPVPQQDEHMELKPEERAQLESLVEFGNSEEEENALIESMAPEPLVAPVPKAMPEPQVASMPREEAIASLPSAPPEQTEVQSSSQDQKASFAAKQITNSSTKRPAAGRRPHTTRKVMFSSPIKGIKVQIASLETQERALQEWQRWKRRLLFKTLPVEIARVDLGSTRGIHHRVYVGPFSSKAAAMCFVEKLKKEYHLNALIVGS